MIDLQKLQDTKKIKKLRNELKQALTRETELIADIEGLQETINELKKKKIIRRRKKK